MSELLPDTWEMGRVQEEQGLHCCHSAKVVRRGPVTNLLLWLEGYAVLVAVLSSAYSTYVPDLMAYQRRIIWAATTFEGTAWVTHDSCYRRRAARLRSLRWSVEDVALTQEAFAGRARVVARCTFCLSRTHTSAECLLAPEKVDQGDNRGVRQDICGFGQENRPARYGQKNLSLCGLFNSARGDECRYRFCKFAHRCRYCSMGHPGSDCPGRGRSGDKRTHSPGRGGLAKRGK